MEFRRLDLSKDLDLYVAGDMAAFSASFPDLVLPVEAIKDITQGIHNIASNEHTHGITACDQGNPIGFVTLSLQSFLNTPFVNIESLYISPNYRGQGIAKSLMAMAEDWGLARHANAIKLEVSNVNQSALHFYHKSGYISTRTQMEKKL